ncbi:MAG: ATP-dependent helicase [Blastocatellia bacterium]
MSLSYSEGLKKLLDTLTPPQREAAETGDGELLIDAGAGSGKTRTMTARIGVLLASGAPPRSILAATFSKAAVADIETKLREITRTDVRVCTLHAWAHRMIARNGSVRVCDQSTSLRIITRAVAGSSVTAQSVHKEISAAKNRGENPDNFTLMDSRLGREAIARIWRQYEAEKGQRLDFDDLLTKSLELLQTDSSLLHWCHETFRHLTVDEFQDTNPIQWRLIRSAYEGKVVSLERPCVSESQGRSLAVVGDPDQAIYGFRGASANLILGFASNYPNAKVITLGENFRSQRLIVSAAAAVIANNKHRTPKQLLARQTLGVEVRIVEVSSRGAAAKAVSNICRGLWKRTAGKAQIAGLFRHNAQLEEIRGSVDVPVRRTDGVFFEDLPEVRGVAALVNAARDPRNDYWLWESSRAVLPPDQRLSASLRRRQRISNAALWDVLSTSDEREAVIVRDAVLATVSAGQHGELRQVTEAARQTGWLATLQAGATTEARERLDEFSVRVLKSADPLKSLIAKSHGFLELLTAHKSKGLEREYVILFAEGHPDPKGDPEEERRLFYVALTRARRQVYIILHPQSRSPFLQEIPEEMVARTRIE